jgi:hypothetical protein
MVSDARHTGTTRHQLAALIGIQVGDLLRLVGLYRLRPVARRKIARCTLVAIAMVLSLRSRCFGGDADAQRFYAHLRYSESLPFTRAHDGFGASLGYNVNRYLGAELSLRSLRPPSHARLRSGRWRELGTGIIMPTIRLRYPLLHDKLEPYLTAAPVSRFSPNQRPDHTRAGRPIESDDVAFAGAVGGLASTTPGRTTSRVGLAAKYLMTTTSNTTVSGTNATRPQHRPAVVLVPATLPRPPSRSGAGIGTLRSYWAVRAGGGAPVHHHVFDDRRARVERRDRPTFNQLYGVAFG